MPSVPVHPGLIGDAGPWLRNLGRGTNQPGPGGGQLIAEGGRSAPEPKPVWAPSLRLGQLMLRFDTNRALWVERVVDLTLTEFRIVALLAEKAGKNVGYREIYDLVHGKDFMSGYGSEGYRANVRTFKFRDVEPGFDHIENYASFGYRWTAAD